MYICWKPGFIHPGCYRDSHQKCSCLLGKEASIYLYWDIWVFTPCFGMDRILIVLWCCRVCDSPDTWALVSKPEHSCPSIYWTRTSFQRKGKAHRVHCSLSNSSSGLWTPWFGCPWTPLKNETRTNLDTSPSVARFCEITGTLPLLNHVWSTTKINMLHTLSEIKDKPRKDAA